MLRKCIAKGETPKVLESCLSSPYGEHRGGEQTAHKVLQSGFFWPTLFKDVVLFVRSCDYCQRKGTSSRRHKMNLRNIHDVEILNVWGIKFIGIFPSSRGILVYSCSGRLCVQEG